MTRRSLRQELSDDAKISNVESMIRNPNTRLKKEHLQTLLDKYGPLAYDIIKMAQAEPANLMERAGQGFLNTRKSIEYFATEDISTETLAKAIKKDEAEVTQAIEAYRQRTSGEPVVTPVNQQQQQMDNRIDERADANASQGLTPTERQLRDMKSWARSIGLDADETTAKLVEKYGALAYNIMRDSMNKPSVIMRNMDERPLGTSKKTVEYFLENDIPADKLAKALKMREEDVIQKLPAGRQAAFDQRVDANQGNDPQQNQQQQDEDPYAPTHLPISNTGTATEYNVSLPMTPARNKQDLYEQAYQNFSRSEDKRSDIYLDCYGHPTTGIGHIIFNLNDMNSPQKMAYWKQRFLDTCDYPNMNKQQQGELFDTLASEMRKAKQYQAAHRCGLGTALAQTSLGAVDVRGAGWNLTSPTITRAQLNENGIKKAFNSDMDYWYPATKRALPDFDSYPLPVQLSAIHTAFAGKLGSINSNQCRRDTQALVEAITRVRNPSRVPTCEGDTVNLARRSVNLPTVTSRSSQQQQRRLAQRNVRRRTGRG